MSSESSRRASGIPGGFGADGANIAPLSPWPHVYYAVTARKTLGQVINAGQQATRLEVLRMYTSANTWFLGGPDEKQLGVLEVGRLGDVVVLSDDYFKVPDEQLKSLRSVLTVVGASWCMRASDVSVRYISRRLKWKNT